VGSSATALAVVGHVNRTATSPPVTRPDRGDFGPQVKTFDHHCSNRMWV